MNRWLLHLASGVIAFSIYALLLLFLLIRFSLEKPAPTRYAPHKETLFEVSLLELAPPQPSAMPAPKQESSKEIPKASESASKTPHVGAGVNQLFAQVEAKVPVKETRESSLHDEIAKKRRAKTAEQQKKIAESLQKILQEVKVQNRLSFSVPLGQYDEFYAKVNEILYTHWNPSSTGYQAESKVLITLTDRGRFSYQIIQKSGYDSFDKALLEFLEKMRAVEFPPYPRGGKTDIEVTFKTEGH